MISAAKNAHERVRMVLPNSFPPLSEVTYPERIRISIEVVSLGEACAGVS